MIARVSLQSGTVWWKVSEHAQLTNQTFRELAAFWKDDPECHGLLQFRRRVTADQYQRLYTLVDRYLPPRSHVLDWGCGNGHVSYGLWRRQFKVSGFSFEDFGLRRHLDPTYDLRTGSEADPSGLPFEADSFGGVMSVGVLEHVRETGGTELASLREIARILQPGGCFICYHFPNQYSLIDALSRLMPSSHHHQFRYTKADIQDLCAKSGLELLEVRRYGALPRNMWHRAPRIIGDSALVSRSWSALDALLGGLLPRWTQNYLFVARKPVRR